MTLVPRDYPSLSDFQRTVHETALSKGFWSSSANLGEKVALIHSELSELLEGYREDPHAACGKPIELTIEQEELADVFIRLLDLAAWRGVDLWHVARLKHEYNLSRPSMHGRKF